MEPDKNNRKGVKDFIAKYGPTLLTGARWAYEVMKDRWGGHGS